MIDLFIAAALSGASATSAAEPNASAWQSPRAWSPPKLSYDEQPDCRPYWEKQVRGFGTIRIGRPCSMRKLPSASTAFSNDNGERGMK